MIMEDAEAIWAAKSDDELLKASRELFEYTEAGERTIRAELKRRGLPEPDPPIGKCARCGRSIAANHPGDACSECEEPFPPQILRALKDATAESALVPVFRTEDPGLMPLATSTLDAAGIEHAEPGGGLQDPFGGGSYGAGPNEIWVREDDEERARALLDGLTTDAAEGDVDPNTAEAPSAAAPSLRAQLVGHWAVVSLATVNGSDIEYPMGYDVEGAMTYESTNHIAAQIMPRGASGYIAYFGTYSVDETARRVTHHINGSLFPDWVGTDQRHEIVFDHDQVTLTSEPIPFNGQMRALRTVWRREQRGA
jgi:Lipocalin-like domain/Putative prokaryotic signal transducing protein